MFDFAVFPVLRTSRLLLRELGEEDASDVLVFRADPEVQKFNSEPLRSTEDSVGLIDELRGEYVSRRAVHWAVALAATDRVIGIFGFNEWDTHHRRAEVGYDLARDCWGRGLAGEALVAVLGFGFSDMDLNRVEAQTIADNTASVRLLERLGFQREGTRRRFSLEEDGVYHDGAIYGLLRAEQQLG